MDISIALPDATDVPVGKAQNVEIRIEAEETEYFSSEDEFRDVVRWGEVVPIVQFTIGAWDVEFYKQWMEGGDSTSGVSTLSDGNPRSPQKFDITGQVAPVDDNTQAWITTVEGVTIPTMPLFSASRNEFIGNEYEGRGDDLVIDQDPTVV